MPASHSWQIARPTDIGKHIVRPNTTVNRTPMPFRLETIFQAVTRGIGAGYLCVMPLSKGYK